jgi:energy-coupling factor transporter ATP-binding protein EcfA2
MTDAVIDIRGVTYTYEGETLPVLRDITLRVREGEFVLILGPSGCGKSTLLQLLNGTIPHTLKGTLTGAATICGHGLAETRVATFATAVGMVFQDPEGQIINTRVRDEVCFGMENLCRPTAEILDRQVEALAAVGLEGFGDRSIFDLSGGQKQRVSIAAVLAGRPRLLVLDEPTANLDPAGMAEIFAVLARLNREHGTTIVMVEHRVDELADRVSRVVMMDRGAIVFDGAPREAFAQRREAASEEATAIPLGAWFPQAAEFAIALSAACSTPLTATEVPLNVPEAVAFAGCRMGAFEAPAAPIPRAKTSAGEPLLRVDNLTYGYDRRQPVLRDIGFALDGEGIVALCGRNGSGKTTLAKLLMGINPPPRGKLWIGTQDIAGLEPRDIASRIGYVFQNPDHQFVTDRVWDEVAYGLTVRGIAADAITERVGEMLRLVDLERYRDRSPFSLSLGERRRLSVATMLVLEPKLLVLDEPTIGQDYERAQMLMRLMARLSERFGTTILMITHDVRLVAEWADRALVISRGALLFDGTPAAMFADKPVLAEAGLLAPPIFDIGEGLAAAWPESGVQPGVTLPALVRSVMQSRRVPA